MWISKSHFKELRQARDDAETELRHQGYTLTSMQGSMEHYQRLYLELEKVRPRTLDEQLVEARRIQKELQDQRTLTYLLEANEKMQKENS